MWSSRNREKDEEEAGKGERDEGSRGEEAGELVSGGEVTRLRGQTEA